MSASRPDVSASLQQTSPSERTGQRWAGGQSAPPLDAYGAAVLRQRSLSRVVEAEIVPRLVLSRRRLETPRMAAPGRAVVEADVVEFARLTVGRDPAAAARFIEGLRGQGATVEALYLDLITVAARRLGEQWEDDDLDFMQVTEGLGRMQHALHELSPAFVNEVAFDGHGRRALMVPAPGEQHTLGLGMVSEFFRRAGWNVWCDPALPADELLALVGAEWFTMIGFSVLCDVSMDALSAMIRRVRRASRNRAVGVMVGGPAFSGHPELAALVGADATAADGRLAVIRAQDMIALLPGRD
jgi:methanogenic corrinoid protein MtbC1